MAGSRLREMVTQASANSAFGAVWGVVSGFFTQSGRTTSYVVASLVHTGVLPIRRAMPVVLWANTGCSLITVAAFLPTESLILLLVGWRGFPTHTSFLLDGATCRARYSHSRSYFSGCC